VKLIELKAYSLQHRSLGVDRHAVGHFH